MTRPLGVTILAILAAISGVLGLCGALTVLGIGIVGILAAPPLGVLGTVLALFLAIGPVITLLFAYGAWGLKPWAWWLGIIGSGISVVSTVISILGGVGIPTAIMNGLIPIVIFVYLLFPDIRKAFRMS